MTATLTHSIRLQGQQLLDIVHANPTKIGAQLLELCGYGDNRDAFNNAIIAARLFNGEYKSPEGIPTTDVEYLEHLSNMFALSQADTVELFRKLQDELGIECLSDFEDLYCYSSEECDWEAEFAEYWATEVCCLDSNFSNDAGTFSWIVIDWQATWDCNLRYDFSTIEFDDYIIIFHNN